MTRALIAAYTPPTSPYPPYINVSRDENGVTVTVRSHPGPGQYSDQDCGTTSSFTMTEDEWRTLLRELVRGTATGLGASDVFQNPDPHSAMQVEPKRLDLPS